MISLRLAVIIRRLQWLACAWISLDDYSGITGQFAFIPTIANRLIWCGSEACCIILQPVSSYFSLSKRVPICSPSAGPLTNAGVRAG